MKEFIYGRNAVYETLRAKRRQVFQLIIAEGVQERGRLIDILHKAEENNVSILRSPRSRLDRIHPGHQGVLLEVGAFPYKNLQDILNIADQHNEPLFVLILDALQDPQNLGTLLRTAEAVGVHGVILPLARAVEVTPAVVNASSGASEHLFIVQINLHRAIETLKKAGAWIVGLDQNGKTLEVDYETDLEEPIAIVVGSESEGMRPLVRKSCDILLKFPMCGKVESLNAAVAGSMALYLTYLLRRK